MRVITFDEFIAINQEKHPEATGELSGLLRDIGLASKIVNRDLSKAGLVDAILGDANEINVQGEEVKKLDIIANEVLKKCLQNSGECCGIASEEDDDGNEAQKGEQRPVSPLTPRNSNGTAAQPLKREEARTLFKTLQGLLTTCNSDREVMQFEHDNAAQIALLGDWKIHFDNAIAQHRAAIADAQGKAA